jgi:hypothetical protein
VSGQEKYSRNSRERAGNCHQPNRTGQTHCSKPHTPSSESTPAQPSTRASRVRAPCADADSFETWEEAKGKKFSDPIFSQKSFAKIFRNPQNAHFFASFIAF